MARAGYDMEELWYRVDKVGDLGQEQEEQSLAEVPKYADNGEHHPSEIAVRIANEHFGWVPIESPQG